MRLGGALWRPARPAASLLEALDLGLPDQVLAAGAFVGDPTRLDVAADRHGGYLELFGYLLDRQQLVTVHAAQDSGPVDHYNTFLSYTDASVMVYT
jgi:hypothetical protein